MSRVCSNGAGATLSLEASVARLQCLSPGIIRVAVRGHLISILAVCFSCNRNFGSSMPQIRLAKMAGFLLPGQQSSGPKQSTEPKVSHQKVSYSTIPVFLPSFRIAESTSIR